MDFVVFFCYFQQLWRRYQYIVQVYSSWTVQVRCLYIIVWLENRWPGSVQTPNQQWMIKTLPDSMHTNHISNFVAKWLCACIQVKKMALQMKPYSSSVTNLKWLVRLRCCENTMDWCTALCKVLLLCVKTTAILNSPSVEEEDAYVTFFSSRYMLELKSAIYHGVASWSSQASLVAVCSIGFSYRTKFTRF